MILADLASAFINSRLTLKSADLMLIIPPSFKSRSFDPVSFLAESTEERTNIPWERGVFARTRLTKPQKSIHNKEFKNLNVLNTFGLSKPLKLNGKRILLIDDVFDSGATLDQIRAILREARATKTYALVLAKTRGLGSVGSFNQQASLR